MSAYAQVLSIYVYNVIKSCKGRERGGEPGNEATIHLSFLSLALLPLLFSLPSLLSSLPPPPLAERMVQMGFTSKEIRESLQENRYDEVCATYMLLKRECGDSNVRRDIAHTVQCIYMNMNNHVYRNNFLI